MRRSRFYRFGIDGARGAEAGEHVEGGVGGRESGHTVGARKSAIVNVVVLQIRCDADPHRLPIRHWHLDVNASWRLRGVGHKRPYEWRTQHAIDQRLQWC